MNREQLIHRLNKIKSKPSELSLITLFISYNVSVKSPINLRGEFIT